MSTMHLNQDRFKAMLTKLDDWKICTSVPKPDDNLMMVSTYRGHLSNPFP